jgi:hypothetical protein
MAAEGKQSSEVTLPSVAHDLPVVDSRAPTSNDNTMTINDAADVSATTIVEVSSTDGDDKDAATVIDIHSLPRDVFGRIKLDVESQEPSASIARISQRAKESTTTTTTVE